MTLFHSHRGELFGANGTRRGNRFSAAGLTRKITEVLKTLHRAIVAAKIAPLAE